MSRAPVHPHASDMRTREFLLERMGGVSRGSDKEAGNWVTET